MVPAKSSKSQCLGAAGCPIIGSSGKRWAIHRTVEAIGCRSRSKQIRHLRRSSDCWCIREHASALLHKRLLSSGYDDLYRFRGCATGNQLRACER